MVKLSNKYSKRVIFPAGKQTIFLKEVQNVLKLNNDNLAKILGVHSRSIRDWKREKYSMPLDAVEKLCKESSLSVPKNIEIKSPFWYAKKGAKAGGVASYKKYGCLAKRNKECRKRRWKEWWEKKGKFNPNQYFVSKYIKLPTNSTGLAEFIGIILGDGSITKRQVAVTLNRTDDLNFSLYVKNLIIKLFAVNPAVYNFSKKDCVLNIVISRTKLTDFLLKMGMKIGNKVRQQVDVPGWITKKDLFVKNCIRGLLDTDGCFFVDKHRYKDKIYLNCGLNFTNRSLPLLKFFKENLERFGYHPTQKTKFSIFLRREEEIVRYFKEIGSSNLKHLSKFKKYYNNRFGGVG